MTTSTSGTKEWADSNVNWFKGCSNNCIYCYAKWMAYRFKRLLDPRTWSEMKANQRAIDTGYAKRQGRIMVPTTHDITPKNIEIVKRKVRQLLEPGNEILITTKPNWHCIKQLTKEVLWEFRGQAQFRFTITTIDESIAEYWEPGAPTIKERILAATEADLKEYKTSFSLEPFLDEDPVPLVEKLAPLSSESIWLGVMNPHFTHFYEDQIPEGFLSRYSDQNLNKILKKLRDLPEWIRKKVRLKDSIVNQLGLEGRRIE